MPVKITLRKQEYQVKHGMTLYSALKKLEISAESVLATRNGELILEDEILNDGDEVILVSVISGGSQP